ncbi:Calmodulin [Lachnellula suecica]|uniref:Calmodulin n=1 Tax=Lachnellula suecica TaxID=602035 RepID=A0A8T9CGV6_9HELO|nr:Calmodulin [Lachnellula suecica]
MPGQPAAAVSNGHGDGQAPLSSHDMAALKEAFALFDSDNDGVITKEELGKVMGELGIRATPGEIEDMINEIDLDQTGSVDLEEFIKMMTLNAKPANIEQEMRNAFAVFDKDNSGTISADEIATVMATFGQNLSHDELQFMISEVDKNGDGTIDCMYTSHAYPSVLLRG